MIHFLLCNYKQQAFQREDPLLVAQSIEKTEREREPAIVRLIHLLTLSPESSNT